MKDKIEKCKRVILPINGGIGRNIFATGMIRNFKKTYPDKDIFVVAGFPEIFQNNPNCKRVYGFMNCQHLFEDYIFQNTDTIMLETEPYRHPEYLSGEKHIVECWCEQMDILCDSVLPEMFFTKNEQEMAKTYMTKFKKPLVLFQHVGGKTPDSCQKSEQIASQGAMYRRSLPDETVQDIVDGLVKDGYVVGSVQSPNQFTPKNVELIHFPIRAVIGLLPYVSGVIAIDSFLQHAAASLGVKSLVLWGGTSPKRLGYELHTNLRRNVCNTPECHRPNSYAFDIQPNGMMWDCPYSDKCCEYEAELVLQTYKEMKGEDYINQVKDFPKEDIVEEKKDECKGKCEHGGK